MIKYPGGEVALWTVLWILAGSFVAAAGVPLREPLEDRE
jgi:hypothetical protein